MYQEELKSIRLLQSRNEVIAKEHDEIASLLEQAKNSLREVDGVVGLVDSDEHARRKAAHILAMEQRGGELTHIPFSAVAAEAEAQFKGKTAISDILSPEDQRSADALLSSWVEDFNRKHSLEAWDYAIACGCGLFAGMLDCLCIRAPVRSSVTPFDKPLDGAFNRVTQLAFNKIFPPELSARLANDFKIGAPDASTTRSLLDAPSKTLNPFNHRLRALSHDPILGFIFGVLDMKRNTCTVVSNGGIAVFSGTKDAIVEPNLWSYLGRMFGHLCSDVNAPSAMGNRGMGLPAPFMGLLRMFEDIPIGDSNFGYQIEWMYTQGYDFRHFVTTSIPVTIMEVLLRAFYVGKQVHLHKERFADSLMETMPLRLSKRFRMMLALAYGSMCAVNGARVYITNNILNANYAAWGGFAWNTFHSLKWLLIDRPVALARHIDEAAFQQISSTIENLELLEQRATILPF